MAQPTALETVMRTEFLPKLEDQVFSYSYWLEKLRGMTKTQTGGTGYNKKLVIAKNPNTGSYEPYGTFRANPADKVTYATVGWKHYYQNIPISNIELLMNKGQQDKTKITDILQTEFEVAESSLKEIFAADIYSDGAEYAYPAGSAESVSPIYGLKYWVNENRTAGGITSSASSNTWWNAQVIAAGSPSFTEMTTASDADFICKRLRQGIGEATVGSETPDVIITTRIIWEGLATVADGYQKMEKTRVGKGSYNEATKANMGWEAIMFDNVPVIWDSFCPGGYAYGLNTNFWEVRALAGANMNMTPLEKVSGGDTKQATILMSWNMMCYKPSRQFVITALPTAYA